MAFPFEQYYTFRGNNYKYGSSLLAEELESNLISLLDWCMLGIHGFVSVSGGQVPYYGGLPNKLRYVDHPNYTLGQVWQTYRKNIVWETGVGSTVQPLNASGVYVNSVFKAKNDLIYQHHINYREGLVIFSGAIPTGTLVQMNYSFKNVWIDSYDSIVNQEVQFDSYHAENLNSNASGGYYPLSTSRVQLPAIGIEVVPSRTFEPYELGGGQWIKNKVLFHVFAETDADANRLIDIISYQSDWRFFLYNSNTIALSGAFPLTASGDRVSNPLMYPALVRESGVGFRWKQAQLIDMQVVDKVKFSTNLYGGIISANVYIDFQEL